MCSVLFKVAMGTQERVAHIIYTYNCAIPSTQSETCGNHVKSRLIMTIFCDKAVPGSNLQLVCP